MDEFGEFGALDAQLGKQRDDSPELEQESALNDESSISIIENRFKQMYEQMYTRIYSHQNININKDELSKQLLGNLSKFFRPLLEQINPYRLGERKRALDIGETYALRILNQFGKPKDYEAARKLVHYLISECPNHGYVVDITIMSAFLENVYFSHYFGTEYAAALSQLSDILLLSENHADLDFIGFVEPLSAKATDSSNGETDDFNKRDFTDDGIDFALGKVLDPTNETEQNPLNN